MTERQASSKNQMKLPSSQDLLEEGRRSENLEISDFTGNVNSIQITADYCLYSWQWLDLSPLIFSPISSLLLLC